MTVARYPKCETICQVQSEALAGAASPDLPAVRGLRLPGEWQSTLALGGISGLAILLG